MLTTLWGLGRDGKTNSKGMPGPLQLAALGRARGYRPMYLEYMQPQGHEEPDPKLLALVE